VSSITLPDIFKISKKAFAGADFKMVRDEMKPTNSLRRPVVFATLEDSICAFADRNLCKSNDNNHMRREKKLALDKFKICIW
jgi:hypothetical protein